MLAGVLLCACACACACVLRSNVILILFDLIRSTNFCISQPIVYFIDPIVSCLTFKSSKIHFGCVLCRCVLHPLFTVKFQCVDASSFMWFHIIIVNVINNNMNEKWKISFLRKRRNRDRTAQHKQRHFDGLRGISE